MKSKLIMLALLLGIIVLIILIVRLNAVKQEKEEAKKNQWPKAGKVVGTYNNVDIYSNGQRVFQSHGKHHSPVGYYYGRKWQCVEFIKRYYYDAHGHEMPNVWGNAKDFFDESLAHGELNTDRGMTQFHNKNLMKPMVDDLLVWTNGRFGHVGVITEVHSDHIVVAQQNIRHGAMKEIPLTNSAGFWSIAGDSPPAGWLRLK